MVDRRLGRAPVSGWHAMRSSDAAMTARRWRQKVWLAVGALTLTCATLVLGPWMRNDALVVPKTKVVQTAGSQGHVLVTGGAGFIGSHATMLLLEKGYAVTIVDNLSRGNKGAVRELQRLDKNQRLDYVQADLGDRNAVDNMFRDRNFDLVIHFAAIAYVGESVAEPLQYYSNITVNTVILLETMKKYHVQDLIYSSTCATYGNQEKLPITEENPPLPINPYGKAKLAAEEVIRDFAKSNAEFKAAILRYFNVYGSDPSGRLGEYPRPALRHYGRISGACFDAALGNIEELTIMGTNFPTPDGTCIRDYIHVSDLVNAHLAAKKALSNPPALFNIGTGKGISVKEFVEACKRVTGKPIKVKEQREARPGDYAAVYADPKKINTELGWYAQYTDVEESLRHAWDWRKAHPHGY